MQHWLDAFAASDRSGEAPRLSAAREAALAAFAKRGFPSRRDEAWKYINPERIAAVPWVPLSEAAPAPDALGPVPLPRTRAPLFVFVNGRFAPALSRPAGLAAGARARRWGELDDAAGLGLDAIDAQPFALLAAAQFEDGLHLQIDANAPATAVTALFLSVPDRAAGACHPRLSVELGPGSRLELCEVHAGLGEDPYLANFLAEIAVAPGATCRRLKLQAETEAATHLATVAARVEQGGRFESHTLSWGGRTVREELLCQLAGEGAQALLRGLYTARADQQSDHHTVVDHAVPGCESRQLYRGVLAGASRGAFTGRVIVRPDAQQSEAEQKNQNLLLSEGAEADSKPQLEIYADDVRCSHGATIGQLDPDQIFYLRSRGIGEASARALLTRGFMASITAAVDDPSLREAVEATLVGHLFGPRGDSA